MTDVQNCGPPLAIGKRWRSVTFSSSAISIRSPWGAGVRRGRQGSAPIMGSYGIGIERILSAAIEQSNDENGFWLPPSIAPFE